MDQSADPLNLSPRALYFLLSWAWGFYEPDDEVLLEATDLQTPIDLLYLILARRCAHILRRGVYREYQEERYLGPGIRGRLDLAETIRRDRGRSRNIASESTILSPDCPPNRVLKYCLQEASNAKGLDPRVSQDCILVCRAFPSSTSTSRGQAILDLRNVKIHQNNREYGLALRTARLILEAQRPGNAGHGHTNPFTRSRLEKIFEAFLRNSLTWLLRGSAKVRAEIIQWQDDPALAESLLPRMRTDLTIRGIDHCMVVDAKYYGQPLVTHPQGKTLLRSSHLYQVYSYVSNSRALDHSGLPWSAGLAYACAGSTLDHRFSLQGIPLRVIGLDLEAEPDILLNQVRSMWD